MKHIDLYSGVGGFALACEWAGIETILFCEIDKFCQKILTKHWPGVPIVEDINNVEAITNATRTNGKEYESQSPQMQSKGRDFRHRYLLTAGFPCQPFSNAGRKRGASDDRYLWPQTLAVIEAVKPDWLLLENVLGILNMVFPDSGVKVASQASLFSDPNDEIADYRTISGGIDHDLTKAGYETVWLVIPACGLGAPHRRDRVWIVAHSNRAGNRTSTSRIDGDWQKVSKESEQPQLEYIRQDSHASNATESGLQGYGNEYKLRESEGKIKAIRECVIPGWQENWYEAAQRFCAVSNGVSDRLAGCRLKPVTHGIMGFILLLRRFHYATSQEDRPGEILRVLREAFDEKSVQRCFRRFDTFFKEANVWCPVHGKDDGQKESGDFPKSPNSKEIQGREVRDMRNNIESSDAPQGQKCDEQCTCQFDDFMYVMSHEITLAEWQDNAEASEKTLYDLWQASRGEGFLHEPLAALEEIWRSLTNKEIGAFRRHIDKRDKYRVQKLKAAGNAIVPQIAYELIKNILSIEKEC